MHPFGGRILHIPYGVCSFHIDRIKLIGWDHSSSVGSNTGETSNGLNMNQAGWTNPRDLGHRRNTQAVNRSDATIYSLNNMKHRRRGTSFRIAQFPFDTEPVENDRQLLT